MQVSQILKTEKHLHIALKTRQKTLKIVREQYLRHDIPCFSILCSGACKNSDVQECGLLPNNVTHYLVPCIDVTKSYLEILEFPEFTGLIFMQTVVLKIQHEIGKRHYKRICNKIRNKCLASVFFANEFCFFTHCEREPNESIDDWDFRKIYEASVWYYNHLNERMSIVLVTEDEKFVFKYNNRVSGVYVMTLREYLYVYWTKLKTSFDIYDSLRSALAEKSSVEEQEYSEYKTLESLQVGVKAGHYLEGRFNVNKHHSQEEAFVTPNRSGDKASFEILISGIVNRNRAIHNDIVIVELLPVNQWKGKISTLCNHEEGSQQNGDETDLKNTLPTGRVIGIVQRCWRDYVASFSQEQDSISYGKSGWVLAIPYDYRIPKIRIKTSQAESLKNHRIVVRIDSWEIGSQYPSGHFVRSLGVIGEVETEISAILVENSIPTLPFPTAVLEEMPVNIPDRPWEISLSEIGQRKDIRHSHLIFSIDPQGCEDVDDTLSVRNLDEGDIELGVHIADVTYFVPFNSMTDIEARSKATTVYLADRRFDMLPGILSSDLCSLISRKDRYAVTMLWTLDRNYEVKDIWIGRTIIRSAYKLTYEVAQEILDGKSANEVQQKIDELKDINQKAQLKKKFRELKDAIITLTGIARILKSRRMKEGAVELEGVEVQIDFGEVQNGHVKDIKPKQPLEVHETVAECMIFANHWAAKKIVEAFPHHSLLRQHPEPKQDWFRELKLCAESKGFSINTETNKTLAESLDRCTDPEDPYVNLILRSLATRAMSKASYFSTGSIQQSDFFHYGLGLDVYTHFTSPIRRYADILVHRLLIAAVNRTTDQVFGNTKLQEIAEHVNEKKKSADQAQKDSQQLFQMLYFKDLDPDDERCKADAIIFGLRSNGVLVHIPRYGIKGPVYLRNKEKQVAFVNSDTVEWVNGTLKNQNTFIEVESLLGNQKYHLLDHITVLIHICQTHAHPHTFQLKLLNNQPYTQDLEDCSLPKSLKPDQSHIIKEIKTSQAKQDVETIPLVAKKSKKNLYEMFEQLRMLSLNNLSLETFESAVGPFTSPQPRNKQEEEERDQTQDKDNEENGLIPTAVECSRPSDVPPYSEYASQRGKKKIKKKRR